MLRPLRKYRHVPGQWTGSYRSENSVTVATQNGTSRGQFVHIQPQPLLGRTRRPLRTMHPSEAGPRSSVGLRARITGCGRTFAFMFALAFSSCATPPDSEHSSTWPSHVSIGFADSGICLGDSRDWNGARINWADGELGTINGLNVTLWGPQPSIGGTVNGIGVGLVSNGADHLHGVFVSGYGSIAREDAIGVQCAGLATLARNRAGIGATLLANYAEEHQAGVYAGGFFSGCAGTHRGINVAGAWSAVGRDATGVTGALGWNAHGGDATGLAVGGIATTCARDLNGVGLAVGGLGVGRSMRGLMLAGLCVRGFGFDDADAVEFERTEFADPLSLLGGARDRDDATGSTLRGIAVAGWSVQAGATSGIAAALGSVSADELCGLGIAAFNDVGVLRSGCTIGAFNVAQRVEGFGMQFGLLNSIPSNPRWARWLPLVNASMGSANADSE